jgi:uncharacterized membrane protein
MDFILIVLRLVHIVAGSFWVGAALAMTLFVEPSAHEAGPAGSQFMQRLGQSKYGLTMTIAAILTVVGGYLLYGYLGYTLRSLTGVILLIGGLVATVSLIYGGAVTGPTTAKLGKLGAAIQAGGKPPTPEQLSELQALQATLQQAARINTVLVVVALVLMVVARYVRF